MHVHGWSYLLILLVTVATYLLAVIASVGFSVLFLDLSLMQYNSYVLMIWKSKNIIVIV